MDRRHGLIRPRLAALVQRLAPGKYEPHQGEAPLQRTDAAGTGAAGKAFLCIAFAAENDRGILVGVAKRPDRGQQHGTPSGSFEKASRECSDRAAGGQVDDGAGQLKRIRLGAARHRQIAVEHSACELTGRAPMADGVEPRARTARVRHSVSNQVSASASAAGVPTCIQCPSSRMP